MAARVETVGTREMGVVKPELLRALVHPGDEAWDVTLGRRRSERVSRVVRTLDERTIEQISNRDALPRRERNP